MVKMEKLKFKIHSIVDLITNSSTVIFTYQDSVGEAKELVNEMLKLSGVEDKNADDIFYYGVFCASRRYLDSEDLPSNCPTDKDWSTKNELQVEWLETIILSIMKNEIEEPEWMMDCEKGNGYEWDPDTYLCLVPKEEKYEKFGDKIKSLLGSVSADGGRDD